jgi:hypothetical protein
MNCPSEVSEIILEIIGTGVLKIRKAGWSGDPSQCAMEADHIHNLPALLKSYSQDLLRFYWEVEKPSYQMRLATSQGTKTGFEPLWEKLARQMDC